MSAEQATQGRMLLISGPSGCGKSTICEHLLEDPRVVFSVSATTRAPRPGEVDGEDYHFVTPEEFRAHIKAGALIEHAELFGHMYGTLREPLERAIAKGQVFLMEIDVQGALQLMALEEPGIYVFVAPPDFETLRRRLTGRKTETQEQLEARLEKARAECAMQGRYDHVVVNHSVDQSVAEIRAIAGL